MASFMNQYKHLKIPLEDIKSATNNFNETHVIGHGSFGKVYKGELPLSEGLIMVALKRMERKYGQGDREYFDMIKIVSPEIMILSLFRYENLISHLGCCNESGEMIVVCEYASYGSLDKHLSSPDLSWNQRLRICIGAARGLSFLHGPSPRTILHRNIKSANILLDQNWNAKVAGFHMPKIGTPGYLDPLYMETPTLTKEFDIYSFGVVLFEVLCGKLCFENINGQLRVHVPFWKKSYEENKVEEIISRDIVGQISPDCLETFSSVAYQCLRMLGYVS